MQYDVHGRQRQDSLLIGHGPLAPNWARDVVHYEVAPLDPKRIERLTNEAGEARWRIVVVGRAVREAEAGEVECDRPAALARELRHELAVEKRACRNPVEQHDRRARALVEYEARQTAGLEVPACGAMRRDNRCRVSQTR